MLEHRQFEDGAQGAALDEVSNPTSGSESAGGSSRRRWPAVSAAAPRYRRPGRLRIVGRLAREGDADAQAGVARDLAAAIWRGDRPPDPLAAAHGDRAPWPDLRVERLATSCATPTQSNSRARACRSTRELPRGADRGARARAGARRRPRRRARHRRSSCALPRPPGRPARRRRTAGRPTRRRVMRQCRMG
jgi:hypothetical protein